MAEYELPTHVVDKIGVEKINAWLLQLGGKNMGNSSIFIVDDPMEPTKTMKKITASSMNKSGLSKETKAALLARGSETIEIMNSILRVHKNFGPHKATSVCAGYIAAMDWSCTPDAFLTLAVNEWKIRTSNKRTKDGCTEIPVLVCDGSEIKVTWMKGWENGGNLIKSWDLALEKTTPAVDTKKYFEEYVELLRKHAEALDLPW